MTEGTTDQPGGRADRRSATHRRIVDAAGQLFRAHGIDGVGVDAVMKEAGLTHGGFYAHFPSKEALAAEVAQTLLQRAADRWDQISRTDERPAALEKIVRYYLDLDHVTTGRCCPLTTLGPDVARRDTTRSAIRAALDGMIDALGRCLPKGVAARRRQKSLASLSTMVGAVVLARMADDAELAREVLDAATASVLGRAMPGEGPLST